MERCTIRDNAGIAYLKAEYDTMGTVDEAIEKLAEYEDAEESGCLSRLPAPIGATVYLPLMDCDLSDDEECTIFEDEGYECNHCKHYIPKIITAPFEYYMLDNSGRLSISYYLNREEAEKRLEEIKNACTK